jgi:hypothetical protein
MTRDVGGGNVRCANGHVFRAQGGHCPTCGSTDVTSDWWDGIEPGVLANVARLERPNLKSDLRVTNEGIFWGGTKKLGYANFPWASLRSVTAGEHQARKGNQRSAFGIGPLGVAFVAATAVSNARARQVVSLRRIRITDGRNNHVDFVTPQPASEVQRVLGTTAAKLEARAAALTIAAPAAVPADPPTLAEVTGVADELGKLAALRDAGVLTSEEFEQEKSRLLHREE